MSELNKLYLQLQENNDTCLLKNNDFLFSSKKKGIAPLLELLEFHKDKMKDASVADLIIGKAAALLLIKGEISALYTKVISQHALDVLSKTNITVQYDSLVPYIENRVKTGMCPMEEKVLSIDDATTAYELLRDFLK